VSDLRIWINKM